jgi:hypothetical protein
MNGKLFFTDVRFDILMTVMKITSYWVAYDTTHSVVDVYERYDFTILGFKNGQGRK